ncbi:CIA30 family protein [Mycobacterium yunnanensis]|uniref:CIA30 family protein n=1 Tax=Mycobacterium yunnanensis TaxID=368477 RepID=A0A9X3C1T5_9MYCO|nr:CIA30 family protein [Mycobacterium yunnanensis]
MRRGLAGVAIACLAVTVASCGAATSSPSVAETTTAAPSDVVLTDLDDADAVTAWTTINDPVMGGKSTSQVAFGGGGLTFSGNVSLENGGGFASARGPLDPNLGRRAAGATALHVHALGDGKTYLLKLGVAGQSWSYVQRFPTVASVRQTYDLPLDGFEPVGMRLTPDPDAPRTLDPSLVDQLLLYILDEQQGPFEITVSGVDATR